MRIIFLGNWSSNIVKGKRYTSFIIDNSIVFDFGPGILESLFDHDVNPLGISVVAITHMHLDHFAGLPELLWYRAIYGAQRPLVILGPRKIRESVLMLLELLNTPPAFNVSAEYVEDDSFETVVNGRKLLIEPFRAEHIIPDNGYRVEYGDTLLFYSGDTAYSKSVVKAAEDVDYLIHEMTYTDDKDAEARFWKHSTYSDVMRVFHESRARHLVPVHLSIYTEPLARELAQRQRGIIIYPEGTLVV